MSETSKRRNVQTSKGARRRPLARPGALDVGDRFGCLDVWTFRRLHSRGLTLLELLLAMTITVMIGAGMVAMLGAVNSGVGDRRDTRLTMMRAAAARSRITDYLGPSRCVLAISGANLTLWLADTRKSGTVHATEIRWLQLDSAAGMLNVFYVQFPNTWLQTAKDLEDLEYPSNTNWDNVLKYYQQKGYIATLPLIDNVNSLSFKTDNASPMSVKHLSLEFSFTTPDGTMSLSVPATIEAHQTPTG